MPVDVKGGRDMNAHNSVLATDGYDHEMQVFKSDLCFWLQTFTNNRGARVAADVMINHMPAVDLPQESVTGSFGSFGRAIL